MKTTLDPFGKARARGRFAIFAVVLLLAGCMTGGGVTSTPIASVTEVSGASAFVIPRSGSERGAAVGDQLFPGDGFRTGASSTMVLVPASGGRVDVYENTDPIVEDSFCFAIRLFHRGKLRVNGHDICVDEVIQASDVGYERLANGNLRVWVFEGQVRVLRNPSQVLNTNETGEIAGGQVINRQNFGAFRQRAESRFPPPARIF